MLERLSGETPPSVSFPVTPPARDRSASLAAQSIGSRTLRFTLSLAVRGCATGHPVVLLPRQPHELGSAPAGRAAGRGYGLGRYHAPPLPAVRRLDRPAARAGRLGLLPAVRRVHGP